jgi:Uma2 family endonuclease
MTIISHPITAEAMAEMSLGEGRHELVRGVLEVRDGPKRPHAFTQGKLIYLIGRYLDEHPIGDVYGPNGIITERAPDTVRFPDISYVSHGRWPEEDKGYLAAAPDLAVEILSPSNSAKEIEGKLGEYLKSGTKLIWVVDTQKQVVHVHGADAKPYTLGRDEILDGGHVLPGFRVAVRLLFRSAYPG